MSHHNLKKSQKGHISQLKVEQSEPNSLFPADRRPGYAIAAGAVIITLVSYALRLDRVIGLMGDDGWYVLLAKSLATGQGYQLINSPSTGILPIYPPIFPLLLSFAYRLWPVFPDNIYLLKSVSMMAMLLSGWLIYIHFIRDNGVKRVFGLAIALATVTSPSFVFLATSTVMSECVYLCLQLATIAFTEYSVRNGEQGGWHFWASFREKRYWRNWQHGLVMAALASGSFLTRSVGIVVIGAVGIHLLKSRLFPHLAVFTLGVIMFAGPWMLYQQRHAPTAAQQREQNSYIVKGYGSQLADAEVSPGKEFGYLDRIFSNTSFFIEHHNGALALYPWFRAAEPAVGTGRTPARALASLFIFLISMIGLTQAWRRGLTSGDLVYILTVGVSIIWVFFSVRLYFPIAPWALYYLGLGARTIVRSLRLSRRRSANLDWGWASGAVWLVFAINCYGNLDYIIHLHRLVGERPIWVRNFEEHEETLRWVESNLPKDSVLATSNPSLLYLYTGRKTVGNTDPRAQWNLWKQMGIRYGVWLKYSGLKDPAEVEKRYRIPFETERLKLRVLDFGDTRTRPDWIPE